MSNVAENPAHRVLSSIHDLPIRSGRIALPESDTSRRYICDSVVTLSLPASRTRDQATLLPGPRRPHQRDGPTSMASGHTCDVHSLERRESAPRRQVPGDNGHVLPSGQARWSPDCAGPEPSIYCRSWFSSTGCGNPPEMRSRGGPATVLSTIILPDLAEVN